jgi:hypothetical protein
MRAFLMHVGNPGNVDIEWTVTKRRNRSEILAKLSAEAPERRYFETDSLLQKQFADGSFNCWGVPENASPAFRRTEVGDVVLFAPTIGNSIHHDGGIHQLGIVKAKCPVRCHDASRILWPRTPDNRLFPWLFFFETEGGYRGWSDFLEDIGYAPNWDPRGYYRSIGSNRFSKWGGEYGYLDFLRKRSGFRFLR